MRPDNIKFTKSHEWATLEGDVVTVGISEYAVKLLTDLTHVELPEVGDEVKAGEEFGEVESVKAVSELISPVTGEVVEVNPEIEENENFDALAEDPYEKGWLVKIKMTEGSTLDDLMDGAAYDKHCEEEEEAEGH